MSTPPSPRRRSVRPGNANPFKNSYDLQILRQITAQDRNQTLNPALSQDIQRVQTIFLNFAEKVIQLQNYNSRLTGLRTLDIAMSSLSHLLSGLHFLGDEARERQARINLLIKTALDEFGMGKPPDPPAPCIN